MFAVVRRDEGNDIADVIVVFDKKLDALEFMHAYVKERDEKNTVMMWEWDSKREKYIDKLHGPINFDCEQTIQIEVIPYNIPYSEFRKDYPEV